jgi:hypothetical protein
MKKIAVLILAIFIVSCASIPQNAGAEEKRSHERGTFTQHYKDSLLLISKKGMYSVEMVIKEHGLKTGINSVDIIVHDKKDRDVVGADITVTPWMPEMGHGVFDPPVVTEKGGGLYAIENIILVMSGHWELRIKVKHRGIEDTVVFDFPDVKIDRGHEHKMTSAPADLDLSPDKLTDNKLFKISYKSSLNPIPINRIHTWELIIETPGGDPVTGSDISLDGDMPEHGHGLPTQPEVTDELVSGTYLVEGLKFSMPGWWVLKLHIKAGDKEDSVTFNLLLKE